MDIKNKYGQSVESAGSGHDIKLLALDLDGTTLRTDKSLSDRTAEALKAAAAMGVKIAVSTGRPYSALPESVLSLGVAEYVINSNGAVITDMKTGKRIRETRLKPEQVEAIMAALKPVSRMIELFVRDGAYTDRSMYDEIKLHGATYRNTEYFLKTRKPVDDIFAYTEEHKDEVENISVFFADLADRDPLEQRLKSIGGIELTQSIANNFEMGAEGVSKANALKFLLDRYGFTREDPHGGRR